MKLYDEAARRRMVWGLWIILVAVVAVRSTVKLKSNNCVQTYFEAGRYWLHSHNLYEFANDTCRYSPAIHVMLVPFSLPAERWGSLAWRLFSAALFIPALAWWGRSFYRHNGKVPWLFMLAAFPLAIGSFNNGQANVPMMSGLLVGAAATANRRWWWAAAGICFAAAFKIYPVSMGMLFILLCPLAFSWRLAAMAVVTLLLPYAFQTPDYVTRQYEAWFLNLKVDDRSGWAYESGYRDLWLLIRLSGIPLPHKYYPLVQLGFAGLAALGCVIMRVRGVPYSKAINYAACLGCLWMTFCGPATESSTYILLAPVMGGLFVEFQKRAVSRGPAVFAMLGLTCLLIGAFVVMFPFGSKVQAYGPQPLGALFLFIAYFMRTLFEPAEAIPSAECGVRNAE